MDKPPSPRVLGILSIVFGSIVTAFSIFGLVGSSAGLFTGMMRGREDAFERYMDGLQPTSTIIAVVMLAMSVALIFIGVGQRAYRRWARSATIQWALLALAVLAAQVVWQVLAVGPAVERLMAAMDLGRSAPGAGLAKSMGLVTLLFYLPYPIVLLAWFRKEPIAQAMDQ